VRAMAAYLRGQNQGGYQGQRVNTGVGSGRVYNNTFNINDTTGNSEATARRVAYRMALDLG